MRRDYCWDLSSNISKKVLGDETGFRRSNGHISLIYERISTGFGALRSERLGLTSRHVEIGVSDNRGSSSLVLCHLAGFRQPIPPVTPFFCSSLHRRVRSFRKLSKHSISSSSWWSFSYHTSFNDVFH